jgi:hypothetical protein
VARFQTWISHRARCYPGLQTFHPQKEDHKHSAVAKQYEDKNHSLDFAVGDITVISLLATSTINHPTSIKPAAAAKDAAPSIGSAVY